MALLLSILFPGLGHLYIGLWQHAKWLIVCQGIALAVATYGSGTLHGQAILVVLVVYWFAMADAYFSAREWNAGATSLLTGANPRIAAMLNLLTKGFGYFYLGDRTKGILCFFAVSAVQVVLLLRTNVWTSILAITLQIAIAADAYRVARERLLASYPELDHTDHGQPGAIERANPGGLLPAAASAIFLILGISTVVGFGALRALSGHSVNAKGILEQGPFGLLYRNPTEHIELTAPASWEYSRPKDTLVQLTGEEGCSIIVIEQFAIYAVASTIDANKAQVREAHSDAEITSSHTILNGHSAQSFEASFTNRARLLIHQRYIVRRRGLKVLFFIETWSSPEERQIIDGIEKTVRI